MSSKMLGCIVSTMLIFVVARLSVWAAVPEAYVQDNGISCKSIPSEFGRFSRNQRGITNTSEVEMRLFCPITPPSFDSDPETGLEVLEGWVFVNRTGAAPRCRIYAMTQTGSAFWSDPGRLEDNYNGRAIWFPRFQHPEAEAISMGYMCDVPRQASIHGSITRMRIGRIHGGI
jgi:hypothetical protein